MSYNLILHQHQLVALSTRRVTQSHNIAKDLLWAQSLHSQYPQEEARRQLTALNLNVTNKRILYIGVGLGYIVQEALNQIQLAKATSPKKSASLYFYEPIPELRERLKKDAQLKKYNSNPKKNDFHLNIYCISDLENWYKKQKLLSQQVEIIFHPAYRRYFIEWCEQLQTLISSTSKQTRTKQKFARLWFHHYLHNISTHKQLTFLQKIGCSQKNPTVIYCGAGPKLIQELQALITLRPNMLQNAIILACDSACVPLLHYGKCPIDLILSIDSGRGTLLHFADLPYFFSTKSQGHHRKQNHNTTKSKHTIPVLTWLGGAKSLHQWFEQIIYYSSSYPLDQILHNKTLLHLPELRSPGAGAVGLALQLAIFMQAKYFLIAGVSFTHESRQSHITGSGYTYYANYRCHRTNSLTHQQAARPHYPKNLTTYDRQNWRNLHKFAMKSKVRMLRLRKFIHNHKQFHDYAQKQILSKTNTKLNFQIKHIPSKQLRKSLFTELKTIPKDQMQNALAIGSNDFDYAEKWRNLKLI